MVYVVPAVLIVVLALAFFALRARPSESRLPAPAPPRESATAALGDAAPIASTAPLLPGSIHVETADLGAVRACILEYCTLFKLEEPVTIPVALYRLDEGVRVGFPQGAPPYTLVNLIGWLTSLAPSTGVVHALDGRRVALRDEGEEDTLVGTTSDGLGVEVYSAAGPS